MGEKVRDVMTAEPVCVEAGSSLAEAARLMRDADVGPITVLDRGALCGIVTDRDIVVRAIAEGRDPDGTRVGEIVSGDLATIAPDDEVEAAVALMRERAVRRLPVVEDGRPVGIVSIGDLAKDRDPRSALADISSAPPNR